MRSRMSGLLRGRDLGLDGALLEQERGKEQYESEDADQGERVTVAFGARRRGRDRADHRGAQKLPDAGERGDETLRRRALLGGGLVERDVADRRAEQRGQPEPDEHAGDAVHEQRRPRTAEQEHAHRHHRHSGHDHGLRAHLVERTSCQRRADGHRGDDHEQQVARHVRAHAQGGDGQRRHEHEAGLADASARGERVAECELAALEEDDREDGVGDAALEKYERRVANPVFPVVLFKRRQLALGYTLTAGAGIGEASLVFMPSLAVAALGVSAHMASYLLLVVIAAMAVGSPLAGRTLDKVGSKTVIVTGVAVMTVGMFLLSRTGSSLLVYCIASVLIGLGLSSLLGAPIRYVTLNETTAEECSAAQGLVNTFTSIGQLLSAAVVGAIAASSPGPQGYGDAFALVGILGVVLLVTALLLKKRSVEAQVPTPQESAHA